LEAPTSGHSELEAPTSIHCEFESNDDEHKAVETKRRKPTLKRKRNLSKDVPEGRGSETDRQLPEQNKLPSQEGTPTTSIQRELEAHAISRQREWDAPTTSIQSALEAPSSSQSEFDPPDDCHKAVESKRCRPKVKSKPNLSNVVSEEGNAKHQHQAQLQPSSEEGSYRDKPIEAPSSQDEFWSASLFFPPGKEISTSSQSEFDPHGEGHKAAGSEQSPRKEGKPLTSTRSELEAHATSRPKKAAHVKLLFHYVILFKMCG